MVSAFPELDYFPNLGAFKARRDSRLQSTIIDNTLHAGFPEKLESTLVWEPQDLKNEKAEWIHVFSEAEIEEIDTALRKFQGQTPRQPCDARRLLTMF